ncbi:MAG: hypothetical protein WCH76_04500 [Candidatus Riflemargulisbacteria bacterium]
MSTSIGAFSGITGSNGVVNSKLSALMNSMDINKDGAISKTEFSAALSSAMNKGRKIPSVSFDKIAGGNDSIKIEDLLAAMQKLQKDHHHKADAVSGATMGVMKPPPMSVSSSV